MFDYNHHMHTGKSQITEVYLDGSARMDCPSNLIPAPGQYLLALADASDSPLPDPVFFYDSAPTGFRAAPPLPSLWTVGTRLTLRGPLGRGFTLPVSARKIALVALDDSPARLHGLIAPALKQKSEIVVVADSVPANFPEVVEVQPLKALDEACRWADFIAVDAARESMNRLREMFGRLEQVAAAREAQVLLRTPMPCGGVAECGVCAVTVNHGWRMACKDGPVFVLNEMFK